MESKASIRQRLLAQRRQLDPRDAYRMADAMRERLWTLPHFRDAPLVFSYVSAKDNEMDTRGIIRRVLDERRQVACPADAPGNTLVWRGIASLDGLIDSRFAIPAPDPGRCEVVCPDASSVVLVPGIAFTKDGHRVGYGGGYFDRFLAAFPGTAIGLAYDFQVIEAIPKESHDMAVGYIVTECRTVVAQ